MEVNWFVICTMKQEGYLPDTVKYKYISMYERGRLEY